MSRWRPFAIGLALAAVAGAALAHNIGGSDAAFVAATRGPDPIPFAYLGAKHMVTGYDHLLFLVGVIFFLFRLKQIALYVSLFSIGHSLTLLAGVFFTANSYLPLMLTATHGWTLTAAGVPLVTASLGWAAASAWQGRHPDLRQTALLRAGFGLVAAGLAGLLLVAPAWGVPWLALPAWTLAGLGMGVGFASVSWLLLHHSAHGQVGAHSAAAQLADQLTTAAFIGGGGALLALLPTPAPALTLLLVPLAALAALGAVVAVRAG